MRAFDVASVGRDQKLQEQLKEQPTSMPLILDRGDAYHLQCPGKLRSCCGDTDSRESSTEEGHLLARALRRWQAVATTRTSSHGEARLGDD